MLLWKKIIREMPVRKYLNRKSEHQSYTKLMETDDMKANREITLLLVALTVALLLAGCQEAQTKANGPVAPDNGAAAAAQSKSSKFRFQQPASETPSAVESAIELSKKYSTLLEEMDKLRQENQRLTQENESLKERVNPCETQLAQTQKELTEANELLIEMRIELNNWKANVLGFRDEMRQADQAQLEALLKILTVLGGQTEQNQDNVDTTSAEETSNESDGSEQSLARDNSNG